MKLRLSLGVLILQLLSTSSVWAASHYMAIEVSNFDPSREPGATYSLRDINNSGQVLTDSFLLQVSASGIDIIKKLSTSGAESWAGTALNNAGQIVGNVTNKGNSYFPNAFVTQANGASLTRLPPSIDFVYGVVQNINDHGQIVGQGLLKNDKGQHAFTLTPSTNGFRWRDLGTLGGSISEALKINNQGQIVGNATTQNDRAWHAFLGTVDSSILKDLGSLGGTRSLAHSLNEAGRVVGGSDLAGDNVMHAFITAANGDNMQDLGALTASQASMAYDINSHGQVVGMSGYVPSGPNLLSLPAPLKHAFVTETDGAAMQDLNDLILNRSALADRYLSSAVGINDAGQIIAMSNTGSGYFLMPVPEPHTYLLLSLGGLWVGFISRKQKQRKSLNS